MIYFRWRRMVVMLSSSGLSAVRVRAFDGTGNNTIDFSNYDSQQSVGVTTTATAPTGSDGLASPHLQTITADDLYTDIPESDVQLTWDSTLNAKFDQRYLPNPAVLSTPSERACAASHLRVWRAIAALCGIKSARSKVSQAVVKAKRQQSATSAAAAAGGGGGVDNDNDQLVTAPPDGIFKSLHQLHKCALGTSHVLTSAPPRPTEPFPAAAKSSSVDMADQFLSPQEGVDYFLVLEDDVSFPQQSLVNLRATVRALMRALPADVDILYLGGVLPKETPQFKLKHKKDEPFYSVNYVWTLQAYVLRPRAVEILLSKLPIWAPVDNFVSGMIYNKELKVIEICRLLEYYNSFPQLLGGFNDVCDTNFFLIWFLIDIGAHCGG